MRGSLQHLENAAHDLPLALDRLIGIGVGADRDHARFVILRSQFLFQKLWRVRRGEQFGFDAVISSLQSHADLPAEKLFNALLADACDFSKKQDFDDDVCIVAVEQS